MEEKIVDLDRDFRGSDLRAISKRLKLCKILFEVSNKQIAAAICSTEQSVRKWVEGKSLPMRPHELVALAELFGTTVEWIIKGKGYGPQAPQS